MKESRITIEFVGADTDKQDVRLDDFIKQLSSVKRALLETERSMSGKGRTIVDYRVVDLRHSSPATVVLEPIAVNGHLPIGYASEVPRKFTSELRMIRSKGSLLIEPDLDRLLAYQDIGYKEKNRIQKVRIQYGRTSVMIDKTFKKKLNDIVGPDEYTYGTISGMLEAVNFHNTNTFTIYPPLGPTKVTGAFPLEMRPQIKEAIGNFVTVTGRLSYKSWSDLAHAILAEEIDIHEPDSQLPTLREMYGCFAGSMGNLNSAEFIDKLRHEDW